MTPYFYVSGLSVNYHSVDSQIIPQKVWKYSFQARIQTKLPIEDSQKFKKPWFKFRSGLSPSSFFNFRSTPISRSDSLANLLGSTLQRPNPEPYQDKNPTSSPYPSRFHSHISLTILAGLLISAPGG